MLTKVPLILETRRYIYINILDLNFCLMWCCLAPIGARPSAGRVLKAGLDMFTSKFLWSKIQYHLNGYNDIIQNGQQELNAGTSSEPPITSYGTSSYSHNWVSLMGLNIGLQRIALQQQRRQPRPCCKSMCWYSISHKIWSWFHCA